MNTIYKITSPSGSIYVGKTKNFRKRLNAHRYSEKLNKPKVKIINSFKKYGFDNHFFEILETEIVFEKLDERETYWIKYYNSFIGDNPEFGMNMTIGGDGQKGYEKFDQDRKDNILYHLTKNGNGFQGKHHTEEFKKEKAKRVSEYNKKNGIVIPKWGAEKGRLAVIKPVIAYDKNGDFIAEYESLTECAKQLNINISLVSLSLSRGRGVANKYIFKYKNNDNYDLKLNDIIFLPKSEKRPVLLLDDNDMILKEYISALEASIDLGIAKTTINRSAIETRRNKIRAGYIFIYKDLYDKPIVDKKTNNKWYEYKGEKLYLSQWAKRLNIEVALLHTFMKRNNNDIAIAIRHYSSVKGIEI